MTTVWILLFCKMLAYLAVLVETTPSLRLVLLVAVTDVTIYGSTNNDRGGNNQNDRGGNYQTDRGGFGE
jgi:hypothetical protein